MPITVKGLGDRGVTDELRQLLGDRHRVALGGQPRSDARRLASAIRLVERALKTGSRADYRRADKRLDALDDSGFSAKQDRARFRTACG